jgi:hypothetical protein
MPLLLFEKLRNLDEADLVRGAGRRRDRAVRKGVGTAHHSFRIQTVSESQVRAKRLVVAIRQCPRPGAPRAGTRKDQRARNVTGAGFGSVGEKSLNWSSSARGGSVVSQRSPRFNISFELTRQSS